MFETQRGLIRTCWRREENVAQQYRHTHTHRAPVVELIGTHTVEEI